MKERCLYPKHKAYSRYGGRGIKVCDRWINDFHSFILDMGVPPTKKHTIDRIDVNGNYEPSNCRWATLEEQNQNTSRTRWIDYLGEKYSLSMLCKKFGFNYKRMEGRLDAGWTLEDAINKPCQLKNQ